MCVSNFTVNKVFRPTHLSIDHLCISIVPLRHRQWRNVILLKGEAKMEIIIIIIIIVIYLFIHLVVNRVLGTGEEVSEFCPRIHSARY